MSSADKDPTEESREDNQSIARGSISNDIDDAVLRANGHQSDLKRQFNWLSALGLGFSITNSWVGYLSNFGQSLIYGGPQVCVFGLVVAFVVQFIITLGLSEIASAFPSTGGQYHFCYILTPEKSKRFTAYVVGWMSTLAWWIVTCSGISLASATLAGMISFFDADFVVQRWQIYLLYVGVAVITAIPVFVASNRLAIVVQASLFLSLVGMALTLFVATGMHKNTNNGSYLVQSLGTSGWNSGTAWLLGITNCMYAFGGTDGALMFFMTDLEAVATSPLPSMELIYQATGNRNVTIFLTSLILVVYILALPSQWVTSGRLAWAFARDNGVPFSPYFVKIDRNLEFPVRTTVASFVFVLLYGLLYLASTTAFNSIVTSAVLFLNITYAVPQGILLHQGRDSLPPRYLNLGRFGYACNTFSILWIVVLGVVICMPPSLPVTTATMNYISVVTVGLFSLIILLWYTSGRRNFEGPHIDWELMKEANTQTLKEKSAV
ncbi:hypothetical protein QQZ08_010842 [Neonectria magnoliae]|uniref:Choline transporter n=1 Tax=Neonectria magnoliae TaxID=2732573 RepID=A0ABR1HE87_9HYPO